MEADRKWKASQRKENGSGEAVGEIAEIVASYRQSGQKQREFCQQPVTVP